VERANGLILAGLKPRLYEELEDYSSKWIEELPKVVWGLQTQVSRATRYSPFFLVYRSQVVLPADLIWTSPKIEQYVEGEAKHIRTLELDNTEEARVNATLQSARYLQGLRRHYDKTPNLVPFKSKIWYFTAFRKQMDDTNYSAHGKVVLSLLKSPGQDHMS
jgi:hypothetical protein